LQETKEKEQNSETLNVGGIEINREEYKIVKDDIELHYQEKNLNCFIY
jgi:two-component system alkaline phosphatase synthesis response regulator PhoP